MNLVRGLALSLLLLLAAPLPSAWADIDNDDATNTQEGDNDHETDQDGEAESGDAVTGQVVGVTSSGDASVDATNHTEDSSAESGDADGENSAAAFVGHHAGGEIDVLADILSGSATNLQEGDNTAEFTQDARGASGDAVAGQVSGVVTTAGGVVDLVLANTTIDADVETGDAEFDNEAISFVGLFAPLGGDGGSGLVLSISNAESFEPGVLDFVVSVKEVTLRKGKIGAAGIEEPPPPPNQPTGGIRFCVTTSDGSAVGGESAGGTADYGPVTGCFTIPAGSSSTVVPVEVFQDDIDCEFTENMHMNITSATGASIGDGAGVGTILSQGC